MMGNFISLFKSSRFTFPFAISTLVLLVNIICWICDPYIGFGVLLISSPVLFIFIPTVFLIQGSQVWKNRYNFFYSLFLSVFAFCFTEFAFRSIMYLSFDLYRFVILLFSPFVLFYISCYTFSYTLTCIISKIKTRKNM